MLKKILEVLWDNLDMVMQAKKQGLTKKQFITFGIRLVQKETTICQDTSPQKRNVII
jgi:hypothetical protein